VPPDPLTRSTAPVAADVDFDLETVNFGRKRSPAKWIIGIAAVLGGLGFAAMNMNTSGETVAPAAAAPVAAPAYEPPPPAAQPAPVTPAVNKAALTDDAKRALMEADKTRAAKMQQQRASQSRGGGSAAPSGPRKKADPFHKGGDKYDPLNASL
jgi:type IV secretory pathway VirB10-like protein